MDKIQLTEEHKARMRLWVAALRGGDYAQGRDRLASSRAGDNVFEYCCMGVGCEVAIRNGLEIKVSLLPASVLAQNTVSTKTFDGKYLLMPASVGAWFGLSRQDGFEEVDPLVRYDKAEDDVCLSQLNDDFRLSFEQIADLIEKEFEL